MPPSTISKDGINVVSAATSASNANVKVILNLSAPGAVKLGVAFVLS
jgi:hypothetical protein